ncbi:MAG: hypothetical protein ACYCTV_00320 [Leptospirales bacterium]
MRMVFWSIFTAASLLFLLENDQQTIILKFFFLGKTAPLPVGVVVILSVILGFLLYFISSLLKKTRNRFSQFRRSPTSDSHQDLHHHD